MRTSILGMKYDEQHKTHVEKIAEYVEVIYDTVEACIMMGDTLPIRAVYPSSCPVLLEKDYGEITTALKEKGVVGCFDYLHSFEQIFLVTELT